MILPYKSIRNLNEVKNIISCFTLSIFQLGKILLNVFTSFYFLRGKTLVVISPSLPYLISLHKLMDSLQRQLL